MTVFDNLYTQFCCILRIHTWKHICTQNITPHEIEWVLCLQILPIYSADGKICIDEVLSCFHIQNASISVAKLKYLLYKWNPCWRVSLKTISQCALTCCTVHKFMIKVPTLGENTTLQLFVLNPWLFNCTSVLLMIAVATLPHPSSNR